MKRLVQKLLQNSGVNVKACLHYPLAALILLVTSVGYGLASHQCGNVLITPAKLSAQEWGLVCEGVQRANNFFEDHGLHFLDNIELQVHNGGIENRPNHLGLYDAPQKRVHLLSFSEAQKDRRVFDLPMTKSLYVSVIVHELAHALADQHFVPGATSTLAHEYIAYVAQISSISEEERSRILARYDLEGFSQLDDVSVTYYQLAPCAFGLKAFLHYRELENQKDFIRELLQGETPLSLREPD